MTRCFGRLPSTTHPLLTTEHSRTGGSAESDSDAFGRLNIRRVFFAPSGTSCWGSSHKSAASCVTLLFSTTPVCTSRVASLPHRRSSRMGSPTITGATRCGPVRHRLAPTAPLVRGLHWPTRTPDKSSPSSCPRTAGAPRTSRRRASLRRPSCPRWWTARCARTMDVYFSQMKEMTNDFAHAVNAAGSFLCLIVATHSVHHFSRRTLSMARGEVLPQEPDGRADDVGCHPRIGM